MRRNQHLDPASDKSHASPFAVVVET